MAPVAPRGSVTKAIGLGWSGPRASSSRSAATAGVLLRMLLHIASAPSCSGDRQRKVQTASRRVLCGTVELYV